MSDGQFRFGYFTPRYEETVAFYRDGLEFPILESCQPSDRGTLFRASSGVIEVLALTGQPAHLWDDRPPQGAFMVIEVDHVESRYHRALEKDLPIQEGLKDQEWAIAASASANPTG